MTDCTGFLQGYLPKLMRYNILLFLFLLPFVGNASAQTKDKEKAESIRDLPLFERAVRCTRHFEGWHSEKHHPYVGWGHRLQKGEAYSARTMTRRQADAILREDLRKFCAMFRRFGADSLLLGTLAFNVGPAKLLGSRRYPKSELIQKLEAGNRDIYRGVCQFLPL